MKEVVKTQGLIEDEVAGSTQSPARSRGSRMLPPCQEIRADSHCRGCWMIEVPIPDTWARPRNISCDTATSPPLVWQTHVAHPGMVYWFAKNTIGLLK